MYSIVLFFSYSKIAGFSSIFGMDCFFFIYSADEVIGLGLEAMFFWGKYLSLNTGHKDIEFYLSKL